MDGFMAPLANRHPYLKLVAYGEPGSGKTRLLANLAIGLRARLQSSLPIGILDTEHAAKDLLPVFRASGLGPQDVLVRESKDLGDLIQFLDLAKAGKFSVAIVDSLSWYWDATLSLSKVQLELKTRTLSATERGDAKAWWRETISLKIAQDPIHLLCAARAGAAWDSELDADTGRRESVRSGVRMKSESEQGYEFGLVVRCERHENGKGEVWRTATVEKDRTGEIDGEVFGCAASESLGDVPVYADYSCFAASVEAVLDEPAPPAKGEASTQPVIFNAAGAGSRERESAATRKKLILEEIEEWLEAAYPGSGKEADKEKRALREGVFGGPAPSLPGTLALAELEVKHAILARILRNRSDELAAPASFRREGEGAAWFEEKKPEPTTQDMADALFGGGDEGTKTKEGAVDAARYETGATTESGSVSPKADTAPSKPHNEMAEGGHDGLAPPGSAPGVKTESVTFTTGVPVQQGGPAGSVAPVTAPPEERPRSASPAAADFNHQAAEASGKILPVEYATCMSCSEKLRPEDKGGRCAICYAKWVNGPVIAWGEGFALTNTLLEGVALRLMLGRGAAKLGDKSIARAEELWNEVQRGYDRLVPAPVRVAAWVARVEEVAAQPKAPEPEKPKQNFREKRPLNRKKSAHRGSSGADRACGEKVDDPDPKVKKVRPAKCPKCKQASPIAAGEIVCASCKGRMEAEADATPAVPEGASS